MGDFSNYRYTLTDQIGPLVVDPLGENEFAIDWEEDDDESKRDFKQTFNGNLTLIGAAFARLLKFEQSIYRCVFQTLTVERRCVSADFLETWTTVFSGRISLNAATWDLDNCQVVLKFEQNTPSLCYDDSKGTDTNMFSLVGTRYTVSLYSADVTLEYVSYDTTVSSGGNTSPFWGGTGTPADGQWTYYYNSVTQDTPTLYDKTTKWVRQVITVACDTTPPAGDWVLVSNTCSGSTGSKKYARPASTYGCTYTTTGNYLYQCQVVGATGTNIAFDNAMLLFDIVKGFVNTYCPGNTVVSDFFQWNPENVSTTNYVTGAASKVLYLFLYQKSDIKNYNANNNATQAVWTWEKLVTHLWYMFKVQWRFENGVYRVEHYSYWSKSIGHDLRNHPAFINKYSYATEDIPKKEIWLFKEYSYYSDFQGVPIEYTNCVTTGADDVTYSMDDITTDVNLILQNPSSDSGRVDNEGFVMIAAGKNTDNTYYILTEDGIISQATVNNTLAVSQLLRDYHRYGRPVPTGKMNNVETTFISTIPTKKGEPFSFQLCCGDTFDPDDYIQTDMGIREVSKATFNLNTGTLDVTLMYQANDNLTPNSSPVAVSDAVTLYVNNNVDIDVTANDTDADAGDYVSEIVIYVPPTHGTAGVINGKIHYQPAADYTGPDTILYYIKDQWGAKSNNALVNITVRPLNTGPVAVNDAFTIFLESIPQTIAAPGVFANDSDDNGFTLDHYDATSVQGATITLNTNGSFTYARTGATAGTDSFTYTIIDDAGLTSTATVTLTLKSNTVPVANPDSYTTPKNTTLAADSSRNLTTNDTTPTGSGWTYTCTAETKATSQGGSVTIQTNGQFSYTPPSNFSGSDTFTYTVSNGSGTAVGTVTINVLPTIYARMVQTNTQTLPYYVVCSGSQRETGTKTVKDIYVYFYSDSGGTVPFDTTGLGLTLNIKRVQTSNDNGNGTYTITRTASGTAYLFGSQLVTSYEYTGCLEADNYGGTQVYSLNPGNYVII
jgi:hypothetical protein